MRSVITRTALGCLALGIALTLSSCNLPGTGSGDSGHSGHSSKGSASPSSSASDWSTGMGEQLALLDSLEKEFPGITDDQQKVVDAADQLCKDIRANKLADKDLAMSAASAFATDKVALGPADGEKIVTIVKASTCQ